MRDKRTKKDVCGEARDTTVIWMNEVEEKLRSQQISLYIANLIEGV